MRPVRRADNLTTFMCRLPWNLGASNSWKPQGLSRPVMGLLYLLSLRVKGVIIDTNHALPSGMWHRLVWYTDTNILNKYKNTSMFVLVSGSSNYRIFGLKYRSRVSNPRPTTLHYATRGHIYNLSILCYKYHTLSTALFLCVALRPNAGHGLLILDVSRSHTTTHHSR